MSEPSSKQISRNLFIYGGTVLLLFGITLFRVTQQFAKLVDFSPLLGNPMFVLGGTPIYWPMRYFRWCNEFGDTVPNVVLATEASLFLFALFAMALFPVIFMAKMPKVKPVFAVLVLIACIMFGLHFSTQAFAGFVEYNPLLGEPLYLSDGKPIYNPFMYLFWWYKFGTVLPVVINETQNGAVCGILFGFIGSGLIMRKSKVLDSHGSAAWATKTDIDKMELSQEKGVILGRNPYLKPAHGKNFLRHDGPEHIMVMAPTRSGKGVGIIIPTLVTWPHSVFVTDIKGENWQLTAGYRQKHMNNKVLKFDPTDQSGKSARYNPLSSIRIRTKDEVRDVQNICDMLVNPNGDAKPDHWSRTGHSLLTGVIMHLCYVFDKEGRGVPTLTDVATFLSCPGGDIVDALDEMRNYAHISVEEFLSEGNIFESTYGEYVKLFKDLTNKTKGNEEEFKKQLQEEKAKIAKVWPKVKLNRNQNASEDDEETKTEKVFEQYDESVVNEIKGYEETIWGCLTHPKVAEAAAEIVNKPDNERGSVISTALSYLSLYRDPVVAYNTSVSDFKIEDLMRDDFPVSLYLVIPQEDMERLTPLVRMIINLVLAKLATGMEFKDGQQVKKNQRCLLMLDEFPAFGAINSMEKGLAYIAGYGLKAMIIVQSQKQLFKCYTKDNSILDNCHIRVFYGPNDDETPSLISKILGKKTIKSYSVSKKDSLLSTDSRSESEIGRELMTPEEVSKLPKDKELVFMTGHPPVYGNKLFYYKEKFFRERTFDPPEESDRIVS